MVEKSVIYHSMLFKKEVAPIIILGSRAPNSRPRFIPPFSPFVRIFTPPVRIRAPVRLFWFIFQLKQRF
jgi:hypothetical protein